MWYHYNIKTDHLLNLKITIQYIIQNEIDICHEFKSWSITPIPINKRPEKARKLKTFPFSWQIYFPAKYVIKNLSPFVTGIIVETAASVDANVQTNVTLK